MQLEGIKIEHSGLVKKCQRLTHERDRLLAENKKYLSLSFRQRRTNTECECEPESCELCKSNDHNQDKTKFSMNNRICSRHPCSCARFRSGFRPRYQFQRGLQCGFQNKQKKQNKIKKTSEFVGRRTETETGSSKSRIRGHIRHNDDLHSQTDSDVLSDAHNSYHNHVDDNVDSRVDTHVDDHVDDHVDNHVDSHVDKFEFAGERKQVRKVKATSNLDTA